MALALFLLAMALLLPLLLCPFFLITLCIPLPLRSIIHVDFRFVVRVDEEFIEVVFNVKSWSNPLAPRLAGTFEVAHFPTLHAPLIWVV